MSEGEAIAAGLAQFKPSRPYAAFERDPGSVSVNVYVHVITSSSGEGIYDATLLAQIDVLNAALQWGHWRGEYRLQVCTGCSRPYRKRLVV